MKQAPVVLATGLLSQLIFDRPMSSHCKQREKVPKMSYQFEDESALEELLNQQLERKKSQSARPTPAMATRQVAISSITSNQQRPSTQVDPQPQPLTQQHPLAQEDQVARPTAASRPTDKFGSWLQGSLEVPSGGSTIPMTTAYETLAPEKHQVEVGLHEDQLQEMSKQRLIKLILAELLPKLNSLMPQEIDKLKVAARLEAIKEAEAKWLQVNQQLEVRLMDKEDELCKLNGQHKAQISQLGINHQEELKKLVQNYELRLEEERQEFERQLAGRDEFHKLELSSKLRVDCDLKKMDAIFKEWDRRARSTVEELGQQFSRVESLLERQALEVNGTNERLAVKNELLSDQLERFEKDKSDLMKFAKDLGECLPRFIQLQMESECLNKEISSQLQNLAQRINQVRETEIKLANAQAELMEKRQQEQEERYKCALEANKMEHLKERLGQLVESNQTLEAELRRRLNDLEERERHQQSLRQQLEVKGDQLKRQNYELHQDRTSLGKKRQELAQWARELEEEREAQRQQASRLTTDKERLGKMRARAKREMEQLNRLQKSLVCSICSSSLVKFAPGDYNNNNNKELANNKWRQLEVEGDARSRYEQLETSRLASENKYVELLKRSTIGG